MKTRHEYLSGECTHEEYYNQFVNEYVKKIVLSRYSKEELQQAYELDKHFNSIKLPVWESMAHNINVASKVKEAGDYLTLAGSVCILKAAARQIINE